MANLKRINLGVFPAGEIPAPIIHTYLDQNGVPIDLTGWTLLGFFIERNRELLADFPKPISFETDGSDGVVRYVWDGSEFVEPGKYECIFWVQDMPSDPTQRYGSDLVVYEVVDAPGETPS